MDYKLLITVIGSVFLAELGDKTQLATMLFSSNKEASKLTIFIGASVALIMASALGVFLGATLGQYINEKYLNYCAGTGFIVIGLFTLIKA
jgi:putative Ca2+/H+ antiporter (TMEM165/GDT1 family)